LKLMPRALPLILLTALALMVSAVDAAPSKKPKRAAVAAARVPDKAPQPFGERADVMRFAADLATQQGWELPPLQATLAQARSVPAVQRLIMPAAAGTAKDWAAYRARFIEPRRLQAGIAFWAQHEAALNRAEAVYGVPAEIIAAIIGVETFYGQITGGFRVIDALATLSFDFPSGRRDRSAFFRNELVEFLKLCRREGLDPLAVKGSFAGAIGWPQFMPSSWNRDAVDFDGDGHIDLANSPVDAIGSVAHFLTEHGWQRGMTTDYRLAMPVETSARALLLAPDIKPTFNVAQLLAAGAQPSEAALEHSGPMAVVELQMGSAAPVYVLGTENFYSITRYNWSSYYAMAVIELGRSLVALRK